MGQEQKKEKAMGTAAGQGGDMTIPQLSGRSPFARKKKYSKSDLIKAAKFIDKAQAELDRLEIEKKAPGKEIMKMKNGCPTKSMTQEHTVKTMKDDYPQKF